MRDGLTKWQLCVSLRESFTVCRHPVSYFPGLVSLTLNPLYGLLDSLWTEGGRQWVWGRDRVKRVALRFSKHYKLLQHDLIWDTTGYINHRPFASVCSSRLWPATLVLKASHLGSYVSCWIYVFAWATSRLFTLFSVGLAVEDELSCMCMYMKS